MPLYELNLVLRPMPKDELVGALKRAAKLVWAGNGVVKKVEYLGYNKLPYAIPSVNEDERHYEGSHFIYQVSINAQRMKDIRPELKLDVDIMKSKFILANESTVPEDYECTLEEELKPPAFRASVRPLLEDKNVRADVRR